MAKVLFLCKPPNNHTTLLLRCTVAEHARTTFYSTNAELASSSAPQFEDGVMTVRYCLQIADKMVCIDA